MYCHHRLSLAVVIAFTVQHLIWTSWRTFGLSIFRFSNTQKATALVLVGGDSQDAHAIHGSSRSAMVHPLAFVLNGLRLVVVATPGWHNGPLLSAQGAQHSYISYIFECSYNFPIFWWNSYIFLYYFHTKEMSRRTYVATLVVCKNAYLVQPYRCYWTSNFTY